MSDSEMKIDFSLGGNSNTVRKSGWANPEDGGTWTSDFRAEIQIDGLRQDTPYRCTILLRPYTPDASITHQNIFISCRGFPLFSGIIKSIETISFDIPRQALTEAPLILTLALPDAAIPRILGLSNDSRRLGVSVRHVIMRTLDGDTARIADRSLLIQKRIRNTPDKSPLAAVTMVFNEQEYLPIWIDHYSKQVGAENCYIVDHGSTDGSTDNVEGCHIIRIPRVAYDPIVQSEFTSKFCSSLLSWYHYVLFSDIDEIVMADPDIAPTLTKFVERPLPDITNMIGFNLIHRPAFEPDLNLNEAITLQRSFVSPSSSMCKATLIARDVKWSPGSHSADAICSFNQLYLFHLRWFDLRFGLQRLVRTRSMSWAHQIAGDHQRLPDEEFERQLSRFAALSINDQCDFDPSTAPVSTFLDRVLDSQEGREFQTYRIDLAIWGDSLWKMPARFVGAF